MRELSFGYLYDFRNPPQWQRPWAELYAETLDLIAWSETVGFTGAWVPEHHGADDGYIPTPTTVLAAIAARTNSLRLGSAVALAPLYHPVRFAEECAVLDILSDGRLDMALAIGYRQREYAGYGLEFGARGRRFDEFLDIVLALWAGETVTYEGKYFTVRDARIVPPPTRGRVPLYLGGFADRALERTAKYADGYFGNEEFCDLYARKLAANGKDSAQARVRIQGLFTVVAEDPEAAIEELAPYYHHVNNSYGVWLNEDKASGLDAPGLEPMDLAAFKRSGILQILTPGHAIKRFERMREKAPVEHFMMMRPPGLPAERFQQYAQLFADEVIPAFRRDVPLVTSGR
ncbi:LLM class flavin-dependent oxidoreductase [Nocardia alni]|uniref:LLM class flavin-dependent oxidoreductase n=1 Tax=Nocardia alni TaxID=2815723 RepID=UPI001C20F8B2|nr:LLM class flavin-dependent oxidoreductase [Nocardia alni]